MPSDRKPSLILPVAGAALLLVLYVGAYYATVTPTIVLPGGVFPESIDPTGAFRGMPRMPLHQIRSVSIPPKLFAPVYWLDRRIRPGVWEP